MKRPPEAMIDSAVLHAEVEFLFSSALQSLPLIERGVTIAGNRVQHLGSVREEKSVSHIKENNSRFCHDFILPKVFAGRVAIDGADAFEHLAVTTAEKNCSIQGEGFFYSAGHGSVPNNVHYVWLHTHPGCALSAQPAEHSLRGVCSAGYVAASFRSQK